jgi:guanylate kinase
VKRRVEGAVTVFVTAPVDELERRLRDRATESTGVIEDRLHKAREQLAEAADFDYVVENDDRTRAAEALAAIVADHLGTPATMARP